MQQTLFAVVSLLILSVLALNTHESRADRQQRTVAGELEAQARGVATEVLDHVSGFAFDGTGAAEPAGFTPEADFGTAAGTYTDPAIADVDDFDGVEGHPITRRVYSPASGRDELVAFTVDVEVRYVNVAATSVAPSGGTPTFFKEIVATVRAPQLPAPVTLGRVRAHGT